MYAKEHLHGTLRVETGIAHLKKCKLSCSDQIPAELTQTGGEILLYAIQKLVNCNWNKEELPNQ
jgi:hypothetical protein